MTLATFSVTVPSRNSYKSNKMSSETPNFTLQKKPKNANFSENRFVFGTKMGRCVPKVFLERLGLFRINSGPILDQNRLTNKSYITAPIRG